MSLQPPSYIIPIINQILQQHLAHEDQAAQGIHAQYATLWQTMDQLLSAGGKRIRPYLTYLSFSTFSQEAQLESEHPIFQIAAAQELLHFALLIHDDIIDRDTVRYGRPNIAGTYQQIYQGDHAEHFAAGAALLAGDLALSLSFQAINQADIPADQKQAIISQHHRTITQVGGGELLDMEGSVANLSPVDYFTIAQFKTASYSFINPLVTGALLASASTNTIDILTKFGHSLGIAFQLADDLLGVYGDQLATGKPITSDLREGKRTHFFNLLQQSLSGSELEFFQSAWGNPNVTINEVEQVRQLGRATGVKTQVESQIQELATQSTHHLNQLNLEPASHQAFSDLINKATRRDK